MVPVVVLYEHIPIQRTKAGRFVMLTNSMPGGEPADDPIPSSALADPGSRRVKPIYRYDALST